MQCVQIFSVIDASLRLYSVRISSHNVTKYRYLLIDLDRFLDNDTSFDEGSNLFDILSSEQEPGGARSCTTTSSGKDKSVKLMVARKQQWQNAARQWAWLCSRPTLSTSLRNPQVDLVLYYAGLRCWLLQWLLVVSGFPRSFKLELAQLGKNLCHCIIRVSDWLEWYYNVIGLLNSSWFVNRTMQLLSPLYLLQLRTYPVPTRLTRLSPLKTLLDNYLSYHP